MEAGCCIVRMLIKSSCILQIPKVKFCFLPLHWRGQGSVSLRAAAVRQESVLCSRALEKGRKASPSNESVKKTYTKPRCEALGLIATVKLCKHKPSWPRLTALLCACCSELNAICGEWAQQKKAAEDVMVICVNQLSVTDLFRVIIPTLCSFPGP